MNKIDWTKYVDYIFCLHYLPNNRLSKISKTLTDINIDINNPKFFSFIYDYEHCIFKDQYEDMKHKSFDFFNRNAYYPAAALKYKECDHMFYLGFTTYRALKIAQYFNYERIIIFEDDIIFLKDTNYIINAMDFVKEQDFDICMCETSFMDAEAGDKNFLLSLDNVHYLGNDMFLETSETTVGQYGGGFIILSKEGINKIISYYENNNLIVCLDVLDQLRYLTKLKTLFALKPLCIQEYMTDRTNEIFKLTNCNTKIENYI